MRGQRRLDQPARRADVDGRMDLRLPVHLYGDRDRARTRLVDELLERHDALVADLSAEAHTARRVPLLHPELGRDRQPVQQVLQNLVPCQNWPLNALAEPPLGYVAGEDARVVAEPVDRARVGPEALLAQPRIALRRVACEVDARHGDALEV